MKQLYTFLFFGLSSFCANAQDINYNLANEAETAGWQVQDLNNDGTTWQWSSELAGISYRGDLATGAADDQLVSPSFAVKAGAFYYITYELEQRSAFDADDVDVFITTGEGNEVLSTLNISNSTGNGTLTKTVCFLSQASENVSVIFYIKTPDANGSITLKKMSVEAVAGQTPEMAKDLAAVSENGRVKLSWTAPSVDTNGVDLISPVDFYISINDNEVGRLYTQTPGSACEYVLDASAYSGEVTLGVLAGIGDDYSENATLLFNLQDVQGEAVLLKTYKCNSSDEVAKWKIYDNSGAGKMVYDLGTIWLQHKLGKAYEEDDWAISPSFSLKADERYFVRYSVATKRDYGATFDVTVGKGTTTTAQSEVLDHQELLKQNGEGEFDTKQFSVEANGNYNVGFHVTYVQNDFSLYYVSVYHIVIIDGVETAVEVPADNVTYSLDGRKVARPQHGLYIVNGKKILY